jgi:HlyD family secretion protein
MKKNQSVLMEVLLVCSLLLIMAPGVLAEDIGALGRIRPAGGVVSLVGTHGATISDIVVQEGETVARGQLLVVFHTRETHRLELEMAALAIREAEEMGTRAISLQQLRLRQADEVGRLSIDAQTNRITVAEIENGFAQRRLERFQKLEDNRLSAQQIDQRRSQAEIAAANLLGARQEMERITLERKLKMTSARTELERLRLNRQLQVERARQRKAMAEEKLRLSALTAPGAGRILEIRQQVGEMVSGGPIVLMADVDHMEVVAEVFEGDLLGLRPGRPATISSAALPNPLGGEVLSIGRLVNPAARTANVVIRLTDAETASKLINMEVDVTIKQ